MTAIFSVIIMPVITRLLANLVVAGLIARYLVVPGMLARYLVDLGYAS